MPLEFEIDVNAPKIVQNLVPQYIGSHGKYGVIGILMLLRNHVDQIISDGEIMMSNILRPPEVNHTISITVDYSFMQSHSDWGDFGFPHPDLVDLGGHFLWGISLEHRILEAVKIQWHQVILLHGKVISIEFKIFNMALF